MSGGTKAVIGILGGVLLVLLLLVVPAGGPFGGGPMIGPGGMMDGGWGFFGILWMLVPLLFWGGLIALVVWAVVRVTSSRGDSGDHGERAELAEEILGERFARGEIGAEEYEDRLRILRETSGPRARK